MAQVTKVDNFEDFFSNGYTKTFSEDVFHEDRDNILKCDLQNNGRPSSDGTAVFTILKRIY